MKEKEILEGNKLIAEFMGNKDSENKYSHESSEYYFEGCELEFHFSWNWLIPVVQKITREFPEYDNTVHMEGILDTLLTLDIENIWKTVIGFIEFYNKKQKNYENYFIVAINYS